MPEIVRHYLLVLSVAGAVLLTNLGGAPLWDRDEPRNAGCAAEMLQRGDWVVPVFNDQLRDAKPVLLYWLIMAAYQLFGVNEFAARISSAMLALGTTLATYHLGRRLFSPRVGLWGATMLATSLMFGVAGRAATPDSPLIFCTTVALLVFVLGVPQRVWSSPKSDANATNASAIFPTAWQTAACLYGVMGVGVLAKGPAGLILPTAVIGMFLLVATLPRRDNVGAATNTNDASSRSGRTARVVDFIGRCLSPFAPTHFLKTCWSMRPLTAIAMTLLVAGPWFAWVGWRTDGEFLRGFFIGEHFGRVTTTLENHAGPPFYYVLALLCGFFPWSVFAGPSLLELIGRLRRSDRATFSYLFLACWVGVYLVLFSLARTKLPSYITPCYPAAAIITAAFVVRWCERSSFVAEIWPKISVACLLIVGAVFLIALPIAARTLLPGEEWLGTLGLIPVIAGAAGLWLASRQQPAKAVRCCAVGAVLLMTSFFGVATARIGRHQQQQRLWDAIAARCDRPDLASFGCLESSWVVYSRQPICELRAATELAVVENASSTTTTHRDWSKKPKQHVSAFLATANEPFIVTTVRDWPALQAELPPGFSVLAETPYFLKRQNLLLIGRTDQQPVADSVARHATSVAAQPQ